MGRVVIFGIDGVPYSMMRDLAKADVMPNFKDLISSGSFKPMRSSIPDVSSVSWSSIITGKNPGEHGVFGFTDMIPGTYTLSFPNFKSLRAEPFWEWDSRKRKCIIINVPFTYPARPMNGFMVSGFVALDLERAVYPQTYLNYLRSINYQVDVDASKGEKSMRSFLSDLNNVLDARAQLMRHLWTEKKWDTMMFVVTGSDRIGHLLWDAYEDEDHRYHKDFLDFFRHVDARLGEVINKMRGDDHLVMMSDHGMESTQVKVNLNTFLVSTGYMKIKGEQSGNFRNIKEGSVAFSMDPGRIYLNMKDKYPRGVVTEDEKEDLVYDITADLSRVRYDGQNIFSSFHFRDDIYSGPYTKNAPDIVAVPSSGFSLQSNTTPKPPFETDRLKGKHTPEAFVFADVDVIPEDPSVEDVVGIINNVRSIDHV